MTELSIAITILDFNISTICFDFMRAKIQTIFQFSKFPFQKVERMGRGDYSPLFNGYFRNNGLNNGRGLFS